MNKQQLANKIWESANKMRSKIEANEYKDYILGFIFYKFLSDKEVTYLKTKAHYRDQDLKKLTLEDTNKIDLCKRNLGYYIAYDYLFDTWIDPTNTDFSVKTVSEGIKYFTSFIADERRKVFEKIFDTLDTGLSKLGTSTGEQTKAIIELLNLIKEIPMDGKQDYDVLGFVYEYLISKFAANAGKKAGEFYTPRSIVKLLVKLLNPQPGNSVYDPACGTGGMLIEAINYINNDRLTYGKIYGQEKNLATSAIARINLFLHGGKDFKILQGDTLRNPKFIHNGKVQQFDCVIANPPFGLDKWGADQFSTDIYGRNIFGTPSDSNADFAWLQHMITSMKDKTGKCAVIMPQGVLFKDGKDGEMRQKLIEMDIIDCIITFPTGIFYSTGVPACAMLLNNNKSMNHKNKICIIDA